MTLTTKKSWQYKIANYSWTIKQTKNYKEEKSWTELKKVDNFLERDTFTTTIVEIGGMSVEIHKWWTAVKLEISVWCEGWKDNITREPIFVFLKRSTSANFYDQIREENTKATQASYRDSVIECKMYSFKHCIRNLLWNML